MSRRALVVLVVLLMAPRLTLAARVAALETDRDSMRLAYARDIDRIVAEVGQMRTERIDARRESLFARTQPGRLRAFTPAAGAFGRVPELGSSLLSRLREGDVGEGPEGMEPFAGQTNLLPNPTWEEGLDAGTIHTITTTFTTFMPGFLAAYVLNSGTVATGRTLAKISRHFPEQDPFLSDVLTLQMIFGTAASDMDVYIRETQPLYFAERSTLPWMVAQYRLLVARFSAFDAAFTTIDLTAELLDNAGTVVAASDTIDALVMPNLGEQGAGYRDALAWAAYEAPGQDWDAAGAGSERWRWQLHLHVVKAASGTSPSFVLGFGEPVRQFTQDEGPVPFTPILARWYARVPVPLPFVLVNVPAAATTEMQVSDNALGLAFPRMEAPWAGSIVGVSVRFSGSVTAGQADFYPTIAGVAIGDFHRVNTGSSGNATWSIGLYPFSVDQGLGLQIVTSAAFAPTTLECAAFLFVVWDYPA